MKSNQQAAASQDRQPEREGQLFEPGVPEGFSLTMAWLDCLPVLFFSISSGILALRFPSVLFRVGTILVITAGALKAAWKFVIALKKKDMPFLNHQMHFFMPAGFALMFLALFFDRSRWSAASVWHHMTTLPSLIFFLAGASGVLSMFWFARHLNSREASANWREQMVNGITQLCVLLGILF